MSKELRELRAFIDARLGALEEKLARLEELAIASDHLVVGLRRARAMLRLSNDAFWRACKSGEITTLRRGAHRVVEVSELREYLARQRAHKSSPRRAGERRPVAPSARARRPTREEIASILELDLDRCN